MSEKKVGWVLSEIIGIGIVNPRCVLPKFKNDWGFLYYDILEHEKSIQAYENYDGTWSATVWEKDFVLTRGQEIKRKKK